MDVLDKASDMVNFDISLMYWINESRHILTLNINDDFVKKIHSKWLVIYINLRCILKTYMEFLPEDKVSNYINKIIMAFKDLFHYDYGEDYKKKIDEHFDEIMKKLEDYGNIQKLIKAYRSEKIR